MNQKAPETGEAKIPFPFETKAGGNNGLRTPPGLSNKPVASSVKPEISLLNMSPGEPTFGANPPLPRRKSESPDRFGDDSKSHHHKGGKKWKEKPRPDRQGEIFESRDWGKKRNGGG